MFSNNEWTLKGKIVKAEEKKRGYWLSAKGIAENPTLFSSDIYNIDCWISKRIALKKPKGQIYVIGKFMFKNKDCYFVAERFL